MEELMRAAIEAAMKKAVVTSIVTGTVKDASDTSCTVARVDAPDLLDVRLNAFDDDLQSYVTIVPAVGSVVLVGAVDGQSQDRVVLSTSEVEKVIWKCGETRLVFDQGGWEIARQGESLKKILTDLIDAITQVTVTTGTGPSGVPINLPAFTAIKQRLPILFNA